MVAQLILSAVVLVSVQAQALASSSLASTGKPTNTIQCIRAPCDAAGGGLNTLPVQNSSAPATGELYGPNLPVKNASGSVPTGESKNATGPAFATSLPTTTGGNVQCIRAPCNSPGLASIPAATPDSTLVRQPPTQCAPCPAGQICATVCRPLDPTQPGASVIKPAVLDTNASASVLPIRELNASVPAPFTCPPNARCAAPGTLTDPLAGTGGIKPLPTDANATVKPAVLVADPLVKPAAPGTGVAVEGPGQTAGVNLCLTCKGAACPASCAVIGATGGPVAQVPGDVVGPTFDPNANATVKPAVLAPGDVVGPNIHPIKPAELPTDANATVKPGVLPTDANATVKPSLPTDPVKPGVIGARDNTKPGGVKFDPTAAAVCKGFFCNSAQLTKPVLGALNTTIAGVVGDHAKPSATGGYDIKGRYGTLSIGTDGKWSYASDTNSSIVRAFSNRKGLLSDSFSVKQKDGTTSTVRVNLWDLTNSVRTSAGAAAGSAAGGAASGAGAAMKPEVANSIAKPDVVATTA